MPTHLKLVAANSDKPTMATPQPRQGGFVLATTALMLIPLMVFAAFAVDVGGW